MADFDGDGKISLDDFRKILTYKPGEMEELEMDDGQKEVAKKGSESEDEDEW